MICSKHLFIQEWNTTGMWISIRFGYMCLSGRNSQLLWSYLDINVNCFIAIELGRSQQKRDVMIQSSSGLLCLYFVAKIGKVYFVLNMLS